MFEHCVFLFSIYSKLGVVHHPYRQWVRLTAIATELSDCWLILLAPINHSAQVWTAANVEEVLEALHDITKPSRHETKFSWRENVRVGYPYYPQFMQISLASREASQDRRQLEAKLKMLLRTHRTTPITKLLGNLDTVFPSKWTIEGLNLRDHQMFIADFTPETDCIQASWQTVNVSQLLLENVGKSPE